MGVSGSVLYLAYSKIEHMLGADPGLPRQEDTELFQMMRESVRQTPLGSMHLPPVRFVLDP